jgi:polysaccharide biosynthesis transport protein
MTREWVTNEEPNEAPEPASTTIDFAGYWRRLRRHGRLLVACIAAAVAIGFADWALSRRLYRATVVVHVEPERRISTGIESIDENRESSDVEFLPTQMRLMKSREIVERVVRTLNTASPSTGSSTKAQTRDARVVTSAALGIQSRIDVSQIRGTSIIELSYVAGSPVEAARIANSLVEAFIDWNLESRLRTLNERSEFFVSQIAQVKKDLDTKEQRLLAYRREKDIVSAEPEKNTTFLNLQSMNRDYAAAVAERIEKEARYQEIRSARPEVIANAASSGLVEQLRSEQSRLEREYTEKLNVYKPEWPAMEQLQRQIEKGQQYLKSVINESVTKAREAARTDYMTALRKEGNLETLLKSSKSEAMTVSGETVEYNNLRVEVDTQRALLDTLLRRQAETEVISRLQGERASNVRIVERALIPSSPFAPSLPKDVLLGLVLGGLVGIGLIFVLSHLDRSLRTPAQIQEVLRLPTLAVIPGPTARSRYGAARSYTRRKPEEEKNLPEEPVSILRPRMRIEEAFHSLRARLRGSRGAARLYPRRKPEEEGNNAPELVVVERPRTRMAEAYRELRTSLLLSRAGGVKSIVVTSAAPQEGKTTLASNLAIALAQLDKTVILVDGDLYNPRLHEIFCVSNRLGLASILAGQVEWLDVLTATQVPGVTLLPAGPNPPDPSVLLASETMSRLLIALGSSFDFVVIDSPPVGAVTDAVLLGVHSDGVILCVRAGTTPRELSASARDKLMWSGVRILGGALTMAEDETTGNDYYDAYYKQSIEGASEKTNSTAQRA